MFKRDTAPTRLAGFSGPVEDPIESLLGFHRRIEKHLGTLGGLPGHLECDGVDARASAAAASVVSFFETSLPLHHADEESDLLPLLEQRIGMAVERDTFRELRQRLESEHREMQRAWRPLRRALEAIGEGANRRLPGDLVQYFRALHSAHIAAEEAAVHVVAARRLIAADRATLARRMHSRRSCTRSLRG